MASQGSYTPAFVCEYIEMVTANGGTQRKKRRRCAKAGLGVARVETDVTIDSELVSEVDESAVMGAGTAGPMRGQHSSGVDAAARAVPGTDAAEEDSRACGDRIQVLVWNPISIQEFRVLHWPVSNSRCCGFRAPCATAYAQVGVA